MAKQLNLLSCGGAITSVIESGVPRPSSALPVAALVQETWETPVKHIVVSSMDSATATPASWTHLLDAVRSVDGAVLITHGTDTISWSAAALAVTEVADDRPVVLTGANVPFGELNSDAPNNLGAALTVCREMASGVWVVFAGTPEGPAAVIEGGYARKTLPSENCITDVSGSPFATVTAGALVSRRQARPAALCEHRTGTAFSASVATFRSWPGVVCPSDPPADRIVVELYAACTAPDHVIEAVSRWTDAGADVSGVPSSPPVPQRRSADYPSTAELVEAGARLCPDSTFELVVCSEMLS